MNQIDETASNESGGGVARNSGFKGAATNSGYHGVALNSGAKGMATNSGFRGAAFNSGFEGGASNEDVDGVAANIGKSGKVKGCLESWLVCDEWNLIADGFSRRINVKAAKVDGKKIKADTWYRLEKGEFVEVS